MGANPSKFPLPTFLVLLLATTVRLCPKLVENAWRPPKMDEEIWRLPKVLDTIGMKRSWLYAEVAANRFPAPLKIGQRAIGWKRSDVEAWVQSRARPGNMS